MFLSDTHLPQTLPARSYTDDGWFEHERQDVLLPEWHLATTLGEIPRVGDFVTCRLLGRDVIVHRTEDGPRAFLNVCPHRMALLTSRPCGNQCRLTCQYHGWEFAADGSTRRIPDAPSFRPLEKGAFGLHRFPCETLGQLVFVRLRDGGEPLRARFGERLDDVLRAVAERHELVASWHRDVDANWKAIIENNLESYHVGVVHRSTLGAMPEEGSCRHEFSAVHSRFRSPGGVAGPVGRLQRVLLERAGLGTSGTYDHCLFMPNLTVLWMDDIAAVQTFEPSGPGRTRVTFRGFALRGPRPVPLLGGLMRWSAKRHLLFWKRVWEEDLRLFPDLQAGLANPLLPSAGLLSRREERIHHFQSWIQTRVTDGSPAVDGREGIATGHSRELSA